MSEEFKWPMPPQFSAPHLAGVSAAQDCLMVLKDGQKLVGKLLRFIPDEARYATETSLATTACG